MKIAFFGDWHCDKNFAIAAVKYAIEQHQPDVLVQLGDFGIWNTTAGGRYLKALNMYLARSKLKLYFVDGNHEDFPYLYSFKIGDDGTRRIRSNIFHLPHGHRWEWDGVRFLALGGAISLDRSVRVYGVTWFPEEAITYKNGMTCIEGEDPTCDVMVTHDAPLEVNVPNIPPRNLWPAAEMQLTDGNRNLISNVVEIVKPKIYVHGHFHSRYDLQQDGVHYVGLDCNKAFNSALAANLQVLDTETIKKEWAEQ